jgi:thiosulfate sulfurtransferase
MPGFERISAAQAKEKMALADPVFIDIRDESSYLASHINMAQHIDNHSLPDFIANADKTAPLIVCCYHGHSSLSAAQFFLEQNFEEVYSLDGGFEGWQQAFPDLCT